MENKFRNEMEITLGGVPILLRPTFENIAAMESHVGSLAWLTWKYSRGARVTKEGSSLESAIKSLPSLSECAQIIYYNQVATKEGDPTLKKYSLEEIWQLVMQEGMGLSGKVLEFLGRVASGGKQETEPPTESEKKS